MSPHNEPRTYKYTTPVPPGIETPDTVETRLGTLHFFDGFPDDATVQTVYGNLDFQRGVKMRENKRIFKRRQSQT